MSLWSALCGLYGHDWEYLKTCRVCDYCEKMERYSD